MRIERAVFFNGRYEGVYSLVREDKLEWQYVNGTHCAGDKKRSQLIIDSHIRLDLQSERFQEGWLKESKYYSIVTNIDFKPEDLNENSLSHNQ